MAGLTKAIAELMTSYEAARSLIRAQLQQSPKGDVKEPCFFTKLNQCKNVVVMPKLLLLKQIQLRAPVKGKELWLNYYPPAICLDCRNKAFDKHRRAMRVMESESELWESLLLQDPVLLNTYLRRGSKQAYLLRKLGTCLALRNKLKLVGLLIEDSEPPTSLGCCASSEANAAILYQEYQYNGHHSLGFAEAIKRIESD